MQIKETLTHLLSDLQIAPPESHQQRKLLTTLIPNLDDVIELLFYLLDEAANIPNLERIKDDFLAHCETITNFRIAGYPIAIEGLAQKFESFLKVIGYCRYQNTEYWQGNGVNVGIFGSTLDALITGFLNNKKDTTSNEPSVWLPEPLVKNQKLSAKIFKFLRVSLRNAVHDAPRYQKKDLIAYSELAIVAYLLAVRDNYDLLAERFFPVSKVRGVIIRKNLKWRDMYLHTQLFEASIVDLIDISPTVSEAEWIEQDNSDVTNIQRKGKILEIFQQVNQLVILGDPGLGKTTTLEYLAFHMASENEKIPLLFSLREYLRGPGLYNQILEANRITYQEAERLIKKRKLIILLDGLNEIINDQDRHVLKNELIKLLRDPRYSHVVITSRQSAYSNDFNLPVFDLQALSDEEIVEYIARFDIVANGNLAQSIDQHPKLKHLCRNPLLLKILLTISKDKGEVPINKGLILKQFLGHVLNREQAKNSLFNRDRYFQFMIGLAYKTRKQKKVSFTYTDALKHISEVSTTIDPTVDRHQVIDTLKDIGILQKHKDFISFSHELYQEYLAAEGILSGLSESLEISEMIIDSHWEQPMILYSGLVSDPEAFIRRVSAIAPLLAAKCIENSVSQNPELIDYVSNVAYDASLNDSDHDLVSQGIQTLLKLGKSALISESINTSLTRFGKMAYRFLGPVTSGLITDINIEYLAPIISLITQSSKEFSKTIIRSLERRDKKEVLEHRKEIFAAVSKMDFKHIPLVHLFRLFKLLEIKEPAPEHFLLIKKHCMKLASTSNMLSDYKKSAVANILIYYGLINDINFITQVIKALGSKKGKNHSFLQFVATHNISMIPKIISHCLQAKNITVQAAGIYYCKKLKLIEPYTSNLEKLEVYQNLYYRSLINKLTDGESYIHGINKISSHHEITIYLEKCELNSRLFCKVHAQAKEGYYSLLVQNFSGKAKLYSAEITPGTNLRLLDKYELRISYIDKETQTILFSMLDTGNVNYEERSERLPIGSTAKAVVTSVADKYIMVSMKNSLIGVIRLFPNSKHRTFKINEEINVRIRGYDNQRKQYVVQHLLPLVTTKITKKKKKAFTNDNLSELGLKLKASLEAKQVFKK